MAIGARGSVWRWLPPNQEESPDMADVVYLVAIAAFLALCVAYVRGCERIIASADDDSQATSPTDVGR